MPATPLLAQTQDVPLQKIIVLLLVVLGVVVVGLVVVSRVKKQLQSSDEPNPVATGFTLSDLRQMHKAGKMSDAEFEKAKAKVIDAARRAAEREAEAPSPEKRDIKGFGGPGET